MGDRTLRRALLVKNRVWEGKEKEKKRREERNVYDSGWDLIRGFHIRES